MHKRFRFHCCLNVLAKVNRPKVSVDTTEIIFCLEKEAQI